MLSLIFLQIGTLFTAVFLGSSAWTLFKLSRLSDAEAQSINLTPQAIRDLKINLFTMIFQVIASTILAFYLSLSEPEPQPTTEPSSGTDQTNPPAGPPAPTIVTKQKPKFSSKSKSKNKTKSKPAVPVSASVVVPASTDAVPAITDAVPAITDAVSPLAAPARGSPSAKEVFGMLWKWSGQVEAAEDIKFELAQEKKRKYMGGLFGERIVVEGFRAEQKKIQVL